MTDDDIEKTSTIIPPNAFDSIIPEVKAAYTLGKINGVTEAIRFTVNSFMNGSGRICDEHMENICKHFERGFYEEKDKE